MSLKSYRSGASRTAAVIGLLCTGISWQACAQTQSSASSQAETAANKSDEIVSNDIIVTATRQSLASQRVPLSLTAVGAEQLQSEGVNSPSQLSQVAPGLFVLSSTSDGFPRFTLRGLALTNPLPSASPTVATYIDDVYQNFQRGISTALYDLQRVEVLRGPQGTTFGRNTTGGAVAYYSQQPTNKFEGYVTGRVAAGDQPQQFLQGAINVPLIDNVLAMRISGHIENKGNYAYDVGAGKRVGASNNQSVRAQLKYTPDDLTTVNLIVTGSQRHGEAPLVTGYFPEPGFTNALGPKFGPNALPATPDPDTVYRPAGNDYRDDFKNLTVTLRADRDIGAVTLTSISHYRFTKSSSGYDLTGVAYPVSTPFPGGTPPIAPPFPVAPYFPPIFFDTTASAKQFGQEMRLASDPNRPISAVIGGYFERDIIDLRQNYVNTIQAAPLSYNEDFYEQLRTTTYAGFASVTVKPFEWLSIIGGVRKTYERKTDDVTALYFLDGSFSWTSDNFRITGIPPVAPTSALPVPYRLRQKTTPWTWDATINVTPTASTLFFARVSKGFRSGGFNPPQLALPPQQAIPTAPPPGYGPESVTSYEAGFKVSLLHNRVRVNGGIYHYDYAGQQVTTYDGAQLINLNAARSKVDGGEIEINARVTPNLELRGSAAYTDARFADFPSGLGTNYAGNRLQQAPEWTLNGGINYAVPVSDTQNLVFNGSVNHRSRVFFDNSNDTLLSSGPQTYVNLRFGGEQNDGKGFSAYVFVNNLTDNKPLASGYSFIPGAYYNGFFETGRLVGLDVSYRF